MIYIMIRVLKTCYQYIFLMNNVNKFIFFVTCTIILDLLRFVCNILDLKDILVW